jgi:hypothetical protein
LASGAGGAAGAIAWGAAPQRGAQPQEYETHDQISPGGASDFKNLYSVIFEIREDRDDEIIHLVTLWKSTK